MSFNWADEVEEELAERESPKKPSGQSAQSARPDAQPKDNGKEAAQEPVLSPGPAPRTPSPVARNGISKSRWANAPDEPAVEPSPVREHTKGSKSRGRNGRPDAGKSKKSRRAKSGATENAGNSSNSKTTQHHESDAASTPNFGPGPEAPTPAVEPASTPADEQRPAETHSTDEVRPVTPIKPVDSCTSKNEISLSRWA